MMCRFIDMVMTIPKGSLFPMGGMNLAFDRELIGPAMYFGLMGDGQPVGRYDDTWAGWCVKVVFFFFFLFPFFSPPVFDGAILCREARREAEIQYG